MDTPHVAAPRLTRPLLFTPAIRAYVRLPLQEGEFLFAEQGARQWRLLPDVVLVSRSPWRPRFSGPTSGTARSLARWWMRRWSRRQGMSDRTAAGALLLMGWTRWRAGMNGQRGDDCFDSCAAYGLMRLGVHAQRLASMQQRHHRCHWARAPTRAAPQRRCPAPSRR